MWYNSPFVPIGLDKGGIFMGKKLPIFYSALLLTGVNLLLRFISTSFQVYLSGKIGATGIGLVQLVLSVGTLAMTASMGGIRTATMYLSAEAVGQKRPRCLSWILSGCILYSVALSSTIAFLMFHFAPLIASRWIGNSDTVSAIRLLSCFLPVNSLCGVIIGHFTGVNKIGTLAIVEVAEQIFSMIITIALLILWAGNSPVKACHCILMGSGLGACFTLTVLLLLNKKESYGHAHRISMRKKLWETAVPLAIADNAKVGISTTENLIVPKRLALYKGESSPLGAFGMVCGMVFPILMFPAAILFGLTELLIPELARCNAAGSKERIRHLAERSLLLALVYGCLCGGILFLSAEKICIIFYKSEEAAQYLRRFALLAPMLYSDTIIDAMIKGLGQQSKSVRYNIITSAMDVALLFILLPRYGMRGYFLSFLVTHFINFILSIRLLLKLTGRIIRFGTITYSVMAIFFGVISGTHLPNQFKVIGFVMIFMILIKIFKVITKKDIDWMRCLIRGKRETSADSTSDFVPNRQ